MKTVSKGSFREKLKRGLLAFGLKNNLLRNPTLKQLEKALYDYLVVENPECRPRQVQRLRYQAMKNLLHAGARGAQRGFIGDKPLKSLADTFVDKFVLADTEKIRAFAAVYGFDPPSFIVVSPTENCNLRCLGCYAGDRSHQAASLDAAVFRRLLREKTDAWGSHFTVISGGEPFLYRNAGWDLLDVIAENADNYFLVFTNGTLIGEALAQRMAEAANLTPAISVEGLEEDTDARRGSGTHQKILHAMKCLRQAGVPFGISVTATRHNAERILSDRFLDFYFEEQGAAYGWIFQYMPIGRDPSFELLVTPEQRLWMLERELQILEKRGYFYVDFWNGGVLSLGCIAAGRAGGYLHVDWHGNIAPCVFFPYHTDNIYELYAKGRSLSDALKSPLFLGIRCWQAEYGYNQPPERVRNLFLPCPIRDHHAVAHAIIEAAAARPINAEAGRAAGDAEYMRCFMDYDRRLEELLDPVWEREVRLYEAG